MPARSWSRMAISVASSCACSSNSGATRQSCRIRTRGGVFAASSGRSMSHSGCGYEPTTVVGNSFLCIADIASQWSRRMRRAREHALGNFAKFLERDECPLGDTPLLYEAQHFARGFVADAGDTQLLQSVGDRGLAALLS